MADTGQSNAPSYNAFKLEKHMLFICPECGQEMNNQIDWRHHLNSAHDYINKRPEDFNYKVVDGKYYECLVCRKWLANAQHVPTLLQYHRFNHLPYPKTYRCRYCTGAYTRKRILCEHLLRTHTMIVKKMNVQSTSQMETSTNSLNDPRTNKEFYIRFLCPLCGKLFARFHQWLQHIDGAHTTTSVDLKINRIACTRDYYCTECSQSINDGPTRDQLRRHHFTHLPYPAYFQCSICHIRKSYKVDLFLHYVKHHTVHYLKNKDHVTLPEEWGSPPDETTLKEIRRLIEEQATTVTKSENETDILQTALRKSFINLEEEVKGNCSNTPLKFSHEQALDRSLNGYENVFVIQVPSSSETIDIENMDDNDLEYICSEMFEEIIADDMEDTNSGRPLKGDRLQQEMQKYIHYLCPECGREFDNQSIWRSHVFEQHNLANAVDLKFRPLNPLKTSFLCLVCHQIQRTAKPADLRRHHFQHMPYQSYLKCTICTKTKSSKPKMLQHLEYLHNGYIQRKYTNAMSRSKTLASGKRLQCLECDRTYTFPLRFKKHCRSCPKRLAPIAVGHYDFKHNMELLDHLQKASLRIDDMLQESGIDPSSIKLSYK